MQRELAPDARRLPAGTRNDGDAIMKLYMHPVATTCRPVRLFIAESNIPVEEEVIDIFAGAQYAPPYSDTNPNSLVPMLEDGDLRLTESSAILKYLADGINSPAYPKEIKRRAKVNEAMDWINTNFYREFGYGLCYPQIFPHLKRRSDEAQAETLELGKAQAKRWFTVLDVHWLGPTKDFLCGDHITIADHFGVCLVSIGETIKVDYSAFPNIERWLARMKRLPSWPKVNEAFYDLVGSSKDRTFVTVP
jgi:glutathione S-transferase